jgi:hypothetical protein
VDDIAFPAVGLDRESRPRGYLSKEELTTTSRQRIEGYTGLEIIDAGGRSFLVSEFKEVDPPGMLSDFAGTKRFRVALTLEKGRGQSPAEAAARILAAIRDHPSYLDLTEEGREGVAAKLEGKSVPEIATALATTFEPGRVQAEAIQRGNARAEELARRGE